MSHCETCHFGQTIEFSGNPRARLCTSPERRWAYSHLERDDPKGKCGQEAKNWLPLLSTVHTIAPESCKDAVAGLAGL